MLNGLKESAPTDVNTTLDGSAYASLKIGCFSQLKHYILLLLAEKDIVTNVSPLNQAQKSLEGYNVNIKILQSRISKIATSGQRKKKSP